MKRRTMANTYRIPPAPPHNEGKTIAAWTLTSLVVVGVVIAAVGLIMSSTAVMIIGGAVLVLGLIAGLGLSLAGLGQKKTSKA